MKIRKTLNEEILLHRISVYCATMANFWHDKADAMYQDSKQGIYTIIGLMVEYMGKSEEELLKYAREQLNGYVVTDGNKVESSVVYNEI